MQREDVADLADRNLQPGLGAFLHQFQHQFRIGPLGRHEADHRQSHPVPIREVQPDDSTADVAREAAREVLGIRITDVAAHLLVDLAHRVTTRDRIRGRHLAEDALRNLLVPIAGIALRSAPLVVAAITSRSMSFRMIAAMSTPDLGSGLN